MRLRSLSTIVLTIPLLISVAACSGSTDTVPGQSSPSGAKGTNGEDGDPTTDSSGTTPAPGGKKASGGDELPDDPGEDPKDPPAPAASGIDGVIEVPQATGTSTSADFVLSQSKKTKRIDIGSTNLTCPVMLSSTQAPYVYIELKNLGSKRALTSIWTTTTGAGPANTANALTTYPGATPPATDADRQECLGSVSWSCQGSPCTGWPGFSSANGDAVEVPPNGSVLVFVQGEVAKTGSFKLNVRTDFLQ